MNNEQEEKQENEMMEIDKRPEEPRRTLGFDGKPIFFQTSNIKDIELKRFIKSKFPQGPGLVQAIVCFMDRKTKEYKYEPVFKCENIYARALEKIEQKEKEVSVIEVAGTRREMVKYTSIRFVEYVENEWTERTINECKERAKSFVTVPETEKLGAFKKEDVLTLFAQKTKRPVFSENGTGFFAELINDIRRDEKRRKKGKAPVERKLREITDADVKQALKHDGNFLAIKEQQERLKETLEVVTLTPEEKKRQDEARRLREERVQKKLQGRAQTEEYREIKVTEEERKNTEKRKRIWEKREKEMMKAKEEAENKTDEEEGKSEMIEVVKAGMGANARRSKRIYEGQAKLLRDAKKQEKARQKKEESIRKKAEKFNLSEEDIQNILTEDIAIKQYVKRKKEDMRAEQKKIRDEIKSGGSIKTIKFNRYNRKPEVVKMAEEKIKEIRKGKKGIPATVEELEMMKKIMEDAYKAAGIETNPIIKEESMNAPLVETSAVASEPAPAIAEESKETADMTKEQVAGIEDLPELRRDDRAQASTGQVTDKDITSPEIGRDDFIERESRNLPPIYNENLTTRPVAAAALKPVASAVPMPAAPKMEVETQKKSVLADIQMRPQEIVECLNAAMPKMKCLVKDPGSSKYREVAETAQTDEKIRLFWAMAKKAEHKDKEVIFYELKNQRGYDKKLTWEWHPVSDSEILVRFADCMRAESYGKN